MDNKHMKKCLSGNANQNQNETRYHLTPTRMTIIKKKSGKEQVLEKLGPSYIAGGM